jgi:hypothetical protein
LADRTLRPAISKWAAPVAHFLVLLSIWAGLAFSSTVFAQQAFEPRQEEPEEFPDFPGREDTFYFCIACHNFKLVAQQGMSRRRWDSTLDFMTERHGMQKLAGKDRDVILDYLEKAFPESETQRGWQNPFSKR